MTFWKMLHVFCLCSKVILPCFHGEPVSHVLLFGNNSIMKIWCVAVAAVELLRVTNRSCYKFVGGKVPFSIYLPVKNHS